jgi:RHS repeat-associated protein
MRRNVWSFLALLGASCSSHIIGSSSHRAYASIDTTSNQKGRLTRTGNGDASTIYQYDALGRVVATEYDLEGNSYVFQETYGYPLGNPGGPGTVIVSRALLPGGALLPDGETVQYGYDASGQTSITAGGQTVISSIRRNARGQTTQVSYGDGTVTNHQYNETTDLRLSSIQTTFGSSDLQSYGYLFDATGNVTAVSDYRDGSLSASYGYDSLDRLTSMNSAYAYKYDSIGNLTEKETQVQQYGVGAGPHALTSAGGTSYGYDANGNAISVGSVGLTWNAENMPIKQVNGGTVVTKAFVGESMWKRVEPGKTTYFLPGVRVENGKYRKYYGSFAERDPDDGGKLKFYHGDHLGSSTLVTDAGTVVHRAAYYPYGEKFDGTERLQTASFPFKPKYQYNFKEKEDPSFGGFYDYGARLYNPTTGRWLSPDTSITDGLNRYAYVSNNPLVYNDPTGHQQRGTTNQRDPAPTITVTTQDPPYTVGEIADEAVYRLVGKGSMAVYKVFTYGVDKRIYGKPTPDEVAGAVIFYAVPAGLVVLKGFDPLPSPPAVVPKPGGGSKLGSMQQKSLAGPRPRPDEINVQVKPMQEIIAADAKDLQMIKDFYEDKIEALPERLWHRLAQEGQPNELHLGSTAETKVNYDQVPMDRPNASGSGMSVNDHVEEVKIRLIFNPK